MSKVEKVIVHMGFQKTGTSSLQGYFRLYKNEMKPHADIYLQSQMGALGDAGRSYGFRPSLGSKLIFRRALRVFLRDIPDAKTIVISRENFVGAMLGNRRFGLFTIKRINPVATVLAKEIVKGLRQRFGDDVEITLLYTTREKTAWLKSVWGHVVRTMSLKTDRDSFVEKLDRFQSLEYEVAKITRALPDVTVVCRSLEELKDCPAGPATAVLDLLDIPEGFVEQHPMEIIKNMGQSYEVQQQFLEMNGTIKDREELKIAKAKIADQQRKERGLKPVFEKRVTSS